MATRRGRGRAAVIGLLVSLVMMTFTLPATAAVPVSVTPSASAVTKFAVTITPTNSAANGVQDLPAVINCWYGIYGPGFSGRDIAVAAIAYCDYPIIEIELTVNLYWNGLPWGQAFDVSNQSTGGLAAGPCLPNSSFYGNMKALFVFGPEYIPVEAQVSRSSPFVNITNC